MVLWRSKTINSRKNEAEINESVAKGRLIVFACLFLTVLLCWVRTVYVLFISHWITGIYMFIPWLEPFQSMSDIMRYGALTERERAVLLLMIGGYTNMQFRENLEMIRFCSKDGIQNTI